MEGRTLAQVARDALQVQDACNVSGVARGMVEAIDTVRAHVAGIGTRELARHPVVVLFAHKLASLAGIEPLGLGDFEAYCNASRDCETLAKGEGS